jgi:hypothetical protein
MSDTKVNLGEFSHGDFELWSGMKITDKQWEQVVNEVEGRVQNYVDELLELITEDIREGEYDE